MRVGRRRAFAEILGQQEGLTMRYLAIAALASATAFLTGGSALAGENVSFTIHNQSDYIISAFETNDGDGWSTNWISGSELQGGSSQPLEFTQDGPCKIKLRVSWRTTDGGQQVGEPWNIGICEAKDVYFDGRQVTYE
jgi:hypothetical protein